DLTVTGVQTCALPICSSVVLMKYLPWFALYVKPRHEKNVALMLHGKGYEAFLPTYSHRVKYNKNFDLPLFPSYVFCRIELSSRRSEERRVGKECRLRR